MISKFIIVAIVMLSGCATTEKYNRHVAAWVGHSSSEMMTAFGPPAQTYTAPSGIRFYSYLFDGGSTSFVEDDASGGMVNTYRNYCKTTFICDSSEVITGFRSEGNSCVAR